MSLNPRRRKRPEEEDSSSSDSDHDDDNDDNDDPTHTFKRKLDMLRSYRKAVSHSTSASALIAFQFDFVRGKDLKRFGWTSLDRLYRQTVSGGSSSARRCHYEQVFEDRPVRRFYDIDVDLTVNPAVNVDQLYDTAIELICEWVHHHSSYGASSQSFGVSCLLEEDASVSGRKLSRHVKEISGSVFATMGF